MERSMGSGKVVSGSNAQPDTASASPVERSVAASKLPTGFAEGTTKDEHPSSRNALPLPTFSAATHIVCGPGVTGIATR